MLKTNWKLSGWISLVVSILIGGIAIFIYYNTIEHIKTGEVVLNSLYQKLLYSVGLLLIFYIINGNMLERSHLQSVDYLSIVAVISGLLWIWKK